MYLFFVWCGRVPNGRWLGTPDPNHFILQEHDVFIVAPLQSSQPLGITFILVFPNAWNISQQKYIIKQCLL